MRRMRKLAALCVLAAAAAASASAARSSIAPAGPHEYGCPIFPASDPLNQEIANAPVNPRSAQYIASIGLNVHIHTAFGDNPAYGIPYEVVPASERKVPVFFTEFPQQSDRGPYPAPLDAPIEGGSSSSGDRHVLVLQRGACKLYELYNAHPGRGRWLAGSGAVFNLRSAHLRPEGWTSADAAGLPIFPLLARYPEVRSGQIDHALRVTVPRTQRGYIHPATHFASGSSRASLPPMGLRLRLKASYSLKGFSGQALVILTALKRYGLIVADNGEPWYIIGAPSPHWNEANLRQVRRLTGSDFEAVQSGPVIH